MEKALGFEQNHVISFPVAGCDVGYVTQANQTQFLIYKRDLIVQPQRMILMINYSKILLQWLEDNRHLINFWLL